MHQQCCQEQLPPSSAVRFLLGRHSVGLCFTVPLLRQENRGWARQAQVSGGHCTLSLAGCVSKNGGFSHPDTLVWLPQVQALQWLSRLHHHCEWGRPHRVGELQHAVPLGPGLRMAELAPEASVLPPSRCGTSRTYRR